MNTRRGRETSEKKVRDKREEDSLYIPNQKDI